ncbi:CbtB domain-containing protein [Salinisphaera sp. Q1T1-3]|uniref:CbtB domain-containing protein n=1 Tax=Salinisphaera sp. Q1T1-3 TaxID=2321229 RepID=UPI000E75D8A9|nr:CbtB domain-containing protein [Salinisphaera sp. Q1T1-3]RJS95117.1 CbtB-domain containing protein [Salinisphaera sp. Q1T1-3]
MSRVLSSTASSQPATRAANPILQLGGAALIGLFIVYGVGFSHIMPVHNAAHDVRHSAVFPCH